MSKKIFLVNTEAFPCLGSHLLHVKKFIEGFSSFGYDSSIIDDPLMLKGLSEEDIVYFSSHGVSAFEPHQIIDTDEFRFVKDSGAMPIMWFWHDYVDLLDDWFEKRWILTGERINSSDPLNSHRDILEIFRTRQNFIWTEFACDERLVERGSHYEKKLGASFIGNGYKGSWNRIIKLVMPSSTIINTPPFVTEDERISMIASKHFCLGWHSDSNLTNGVVVERVYEGLGMGCIVFTDNRWAPEMTAGHAIYVRSLRETILKMLYFSIRRGPRKKLQIQGREWISQNGTYAHRARDFLSAMKELEVRNNHG